MICGTIFDAICETFWGAILGLYSRLSFGLFLNFFWDYIGFILGVAGHWRGLAPWGDLRTTTSTNLGERPQALIRSFKGLL